MNTFDVVNILERVYSDKYPKIKDIEVLLNMNVSAEIKKITAFADQVKSRFMGEDILIRGIVEFSNICGNQCVYCGLNVGNKNIKRYSLIESEVMNSVQDMYGLGIKTVVLQSGENSALDPVWLKDIIFNIKESYDMAVTLSVGEKKHREYKMWKEAGADRYLLKIETANERLYRALHPGMDYSNRRKCLRLLRDIGYQVGSGNIVGLKGQSVSNIAEDILFFLKEDLDMISVSPYIHHKNSSLDKNEGSDPMMVIKAIALTRITAKNVHMPSTTAMEYLGKAHKKKAMESGANVIMINFTPLAVKNLYNIYGRQNKKNIKKCDSQHINDISKKFARKLDFSRGDSFKPEKKIKRILSHV
ncbi:biotin synthase [Candidatus Omnitrophus magneticus]|uniref:Biotin synthase n=1 Tax=Candidatus Omnitrophus magneticus TaxID=1609969 RepID=A0A0F0CTS1_9BACT|nr:biotin synthase [Candidatus Omnitrophus magneticus]